VARESAEQRAQRARRIVAALAKAYPDARCALNHKSALELLVATILSAQCTDARVNVVTKSLFGKYPNAGAYASADPGQLEQDVRSTGFFRNKTKSLIGAGKAIVDRFGGRVPESMPELLELPGVARKTANVVLGTWFGKADGVVVDTHVHRVTRRLKLTREDDPARIERDLMQLVPRERWIAFSHEVIQHGRRVCSARRPLCAQCPIKEWCPSAGKV
jgi:endonuclease III